MTRWQLAREVCIELAPWFRSFATRLAVFGMAGYLAGYLAAGPRGAMAGFGLGGLYVGVCELLNGRIP